MRKLMSRKVLTGATWAGVVTALLCLPYVCMETPPGEMRVLRIGFLLPVTILLYQVAIAWSPIPDGQPMLREPCRRDLHTAIAAGVVLGCLKWLAVDMWLQQWAPGGRANTLAELFAELPWVALFQPLAVVAAVYAFAVRLSRRPLWAKFAVILAYQGLLAAQLDGIQMPVNAKLAILLLAGLVGLVLGTLYQRMGWAGAVIVSTIVHLRHVFRILL